MMKRISMALTAALLILASSLAAQAQTHTVRGTIQEVGANSSVRPLAGAEVRLMPGNYHAVSDAAGAYVISGVPRGAYTARITAPSHLSATSAVVVDGDVTLNYTLAIADIARVEVRGFVSESGSFGTRPLAGATVRFEPGGYQTHTDASGRFVVADIPASTYRVTASAPGHRSVSQTFVARVGEEVRINLPVSDSSRPGGEHIGLSGAIRGADGRGISGAQIRITPGNQLVTTGSDGSFTLPALRSGKYTVHVTARGYVPANVRVSVSSDGSLDRSLDLTLRPVGQEKHEADEDDRYERDDRDRHDGDEYENDDDGDKRKKDKKAKEPKQKKNKKGKKGDKADDRGHSGKIDRQQPSDDTDDSEVLGGSGRSNQGSTRGSGRNTRTQ